MHVYQSIHRTKTDPDIIHWRLEMNFELSKRELAAATSLEALASHFQKRAVGGVFSVHVERKIIEELRKAKQELDKDASQTNPPA